MPPQGGRWSRPGVTAEGPCAPPAAWLDVMGTGASIKQTFAGLVIPTPHATARMRLPWTFSTFDYPELCELLFERCDAEFETAKVDGRVAADPPAPGVVDEE